MFTVTLLGTPAKPNVDPAFVDAVRGAWGGRNVVWLSPAVAVEFEIPTLPENRWQVWQDLQMMKVDVVVQPTEGRRKMVLLADMDSTMIQQECIDELADVAGIGDQVKAVTIRAMNGELGFEASLIERVNLLKGLDESVISEVIENRITLTPGGAELVATMRKNGAYTALVSGGFTAFTGMVADKLGFDENRANGLLTENGKLTGAVEMPILGRDAKVTAMAEICAKTGLTQTHVMAVGDGANDLGMLNAAGVGVALHAKPAVAEQCDVRINHGDLTALLYIQGYAKDEFVTE